MYNKSFQVLWAHIDANRHLRHSAYADFAAQVRLGYFHDHGFSTEEFAKLQIGAILFREETIYYREIGINELVKVDLFLAGARKNGSRWRVVHTIFRSDGIKAATIEADGAWMDLIKRKLTNPPKKIVHMLEHMPKTADFDFWPDKTS